MAENELSPEEKYFMKRDMELREQLRGRMEAGATGAQSQQHVAVSDSQTLVQRLQALGIDADAARALHLMPLVEVAWADGSVTQNERAAIMRAAAAHEINPGSPAGHFLATLLEKKPSTELLANIRGILKELLAAQGVKPTNVIDACHKVAEASGGFLGMGNRVSDAEQKVIDQIAARLSDDAKQRVEKTLR